MLGKQKKVLLKFKPIGDTSAHAFKVSTTMKKITVRNSVEKPHVS